MNAKSAGSNRAVRKESYGSRRSGLMDVEKVYDTALLGAKYKASDPHSVALQAVARAAADEMKERCAIIAGNTTKFVRVAGDQVMQVSIANAIRALPCGEFTEETK